MSDKIDDGGFAFPHPYDSPGGMSLRDYFAADALTTMKVEYFATTSAGVHGASFGTAQPVVSQDSPAAIARRAYWIADAMLAERKQAKP